MRPLNVLFLACIFLVMLLGHVTTSFLLRPQFAPVIEKEFSQPVGAFLPVSADEPYWEFVNLSSQKIEIEGVPGDFSPGPMAHKLPWRALENQGMARMGGKSFRFPSDAMKVAPVLIPYNDEPHCPMCQKTSAAWTIPAGTHQVDRTLVIPAGLSVTIHGGAQLMFAESAGWLSRSPVRMLGTKDRPVVLQGGLGFLFLLKEGQHDLSHVQWRRASAPQFFGYSLKAMANFVGGSVRGDHWLLQDADALESVSFQYGKFHVTDVRIERSLASAIGVRGSKGHLSNVSVVGAKKVLQQDSFSSVEIQ